MGFRSDTKPKVLPTTVFLHSTDQAFVFRGIPGSTVHIATDLAPALAAVFVCARRKLGCDDRPVIKRSLLNYGIAISTWT